MKHDQLLIAVRGVVEGIEVERDVPRRFIERLDEQVGEDIPQTPQISDRDGVLKPRERRLTGQVGIIGQAIRDHFEDGVRPQSVVVVLVS